MSATSPRVRAEALSLDEVIAEVSHAGAGGIATFLGVVRDFNDGRAVTLLEYEAYGVMAESELGRILEEIAAEMPDVKVAATHRVGALRVGDAAVACAASAPHRAEAFKACREAIDRIKARAFWGTAAAVGARLRGLAAELGADEVAVLSTCHDPAARRRSYTLLAAEFGLAGQSLAA